MKLFKKKTVYIVLIIIFTLILIADLVIRFAVPAKSSSSDRGGFSGMPGSFSGDFDSNNIPSDFSDFQQGSMPGGNGTFDVENMPEGFDPQQGGFTPGSMPDSGSFDSGSMPDGGSFDPENMTGDFSGFTPGDRISRSGRSASEEKGFVGIVKKFWMPIAVVCALVDAVCVFMLLRISKNQKQEKSDSGSKDSEEDYDDSPRRKKPFWILLFVPVLVIAIVLETLPKTKKEEMSSMSVKENVLTAETEKKKLSTVYLGGGTLSQEETTEVSVPGSIKIDSYTVENGDMVKAGDLIATVNKSSVLSQIRDVQTTVAEIDEKLKDELDEKDTEKLTSGAAGRVKAIYAEEGKAVSDTMLEYEALLLISLDGLMSAEIPAGDLTAGDSVTVVLPDETEENGYVISVLDGKATITVSDENAGLDDEVTIKNADGEVLATSTLSVNSALKVVASHGVTDTVEVEVGDEVKKGDTLLTLRNEERSPEYIQLMGEREELLDQMKKLFALYDSGEIRAESAGEISGLNEDILIDDDEKETEVITVSKWIVIDPENLGAGDAPKAGGDEQKQNAPEQTEPQQQTPDQQTPNQQSPDQGTTPDQQSTQQQTPDQQTPDQQTPGNTQNPSGQSGQFPGGGDMPSGFGDGSRSGAPSGSGNMNAAPQQTETEQNTKTQSSYALSEIAIYSIAPREEMTIEITVDELDIRSLHVGDQTSVTLDAIPGQSFDGKITKIGEEGSYDSGNTKYTVTVSVPKTEQMYTGMNAVISVTVSENEYLTIPVAALTEEGGKTYVYTIYDEEKEKLDGLKEVTTGVSDGEDVQIVSGLSEGDKVYYRYADSIEFTFVRPN